MPVKKLNKLPDQAARLNQAFLYLKTNGIIRLKKEMAARLEIHEQHFSRLLRGVGESISLKTATRIEKEFGIPAKWIFNGIGEMIPKKGIKITSTDNYIPDNVIYHIPYENITELAHEIDTSKLSKWCIPGLKGEYLSISIPNKNFEPDVPLNSILIIKEVDEQQPESLNVLISGGKIFYTDKIRKAERIFAVISYIPRPLL